MGVCDRMAFRRLAADSSSEVDSRTRGCRGRERDGWSGLQGIHAPTVVRAAKLQLEQRRGGGMGGSEDRKTRW